MPNDLVCKHRCCGLPPARRALIAAALALLPLLTSPWDARAETGEVRIGGGFGIHYLPFYVMEHEGLIEKRAKAAGMPGLKATYPRFSGGASLNDALLSSSVDIVGTGVGPFAILWAKTRGSLNVRGLAAMGDIPLILLTNEARIKSVKDIREGDRIALPAVRASMQATLLQMAAAKALGGANYRALDPYTVSLPHSDATTALVSRSGLVDVHFSVAPYSTRALRDQSIHAIIDSTEIVGGPMSFNLVSTTEHFHASNPKVIAVFMAALSDAMALIKTNKPLAAKIYKAIDAGAPVDVETIETVLQDPKFDYTVNPHGVGKFVGFMEQTGLIKEKIKSWRDLFFNDADGLSGT